MLLLRGGHCIVCLQGHNQRMQGLMNGAESIHSTADLMYASDVMLLLMHRQPSGADWQYMEDLLSQIEAGKIPAPSKVEQR